MGGAEAYRVDGGPAGVGLDRVSSSLRLAWRVSYTAADLCVTGFLVTIVPPNTPPSPL